MKKFISFSAFTIMVILCLLIKSTVEAQVIVGQRAVVVAPRVMARPICPGPAYVWRDNRWTMRRYHRPHVAYGVRIHPKPALRPRRYGW